MARSAGRFATDPASVTRWAGEMRSDYVVTLEATGNALAIARLIEPFARSSSPTRRRLRVRRRFGRRTDKIDARTLATLLAGGFLPDV